ncbi:unnamed protein product [Prunus brigantina]
MVRMLNCQYIKGRAAPLLPFFAIVSILKLQSREFSKGFLGAICLWFHFQKIKVKFCLSMSSWSDMFDSQNTRSSGSTFRDDVDDLDMVNEMYDAIEQMDEDMPSVSMEILSTEGQEERADHEPNATLFFAKEKFILGQLLLPSKCCGKMIESNHSSQKT